jgi:hypothetical protein
VLLTGKRASMLLTGMFAACGQGSEGEPRRTILLFRVKHVWEFGQGHGS